MLFVNLESNKFTPPTLQILDFGGTKGPLVEDVQAYALFFQRQMQTLQLLSYELFVAVFSLSERPPGLH